MDIFRFGDFESVEHVSPEESVAVVFLPRKSKKVLTCGICPALKHDARVRVFEQRLRGAQRQGKRTQQITIGDVVSLYKTLESVIETQKLRHSTRQTCEIRVCS